MSLPEITPELATYSVFVIIAITGTLGFLGYFEARINRLLISLFQIIYVPVDQISQWCRNANQAVLVWLRNQAAAESPDGSTTHISYYVFGAVFYSALTALFLYCDLGLLMQTLDAMFGMGFDFISEEPLQLMAWGLVATTVVWPALIFDALGVTHLAPWVGRLTLFWRRIIMGVCFFFLLVSLSAYISVPYWRYDTMKYSMTYPSQTEMSITDFGETLDFDSLEQQLASLVSAEPNTYQPPIWALFCIVILSAFSLIGGTIVSLTGALPAIKWAYLGVVAIALMPLLALISFFTSLLSNVFSLFYRLFEDFMNLFIALGQRIISLVDWEPEVLANKDQSTEGGQNDAPGSAMVRTQAKESEAAAEGQPQEPVYRPASSGFDPFGTV